MVQQRNEQEMPAWVTDLDLGELRYTFIRLVPRGTTTPADTITVEHVDVDVDEQGNVIGITIPSWRPGG